MFLTILFAMFGIAGFFICFRGFFPVKIEISYPVATIYKKSLIPPFKDITIIVPNVKRAIIATKRDFKGKLSYRLELESFDGTIVPVTSSFDSAYSYISKQRLLLKINESINEKLPFEYVITQYENIFIGACFIIISMAFAYFQYGK